MGSSSFWITILWFYILCTLYYSNLSTKFAISLLALVWIWSSIISATLSFVISWISWCSLSICMCCMYYLCQWIYLQHWHSYLIFKFLIWSGAYNCKWRVVYRIVYLTHILNLGCSDISSLLAVSSESWYTSDCLSAVCFWINNNAWIKCMYLLLSVILQDSSQKFWISVFLKRNRIDRFRLHQISWRI